MQFFIARADKHVFDEMRLPGHFCDKADFQAGICVSTAEGIDHEQALAGKLLGDQFFQICPDFRAERFVIVFAFTLIGPPDGVPGDIVTNDVLIFWRTAGEDAGIDGNGTQIGYYTTLKPLQ
ncbi:hypothetical protein D3C79_662300 [compost metagenome]